MDTVRPREGKRLYMVTGSTIRAWSYPVGSFTENQTEDEFTQVVANIIPREPLMTIKLESEQAAKALMDDLYYGEYDGG